MQTYLVFYIVAGLLLVTEAFTPGLFIFIAFALGTLIAGVVDQFTSLPFVALLAIDLAVSLLALFLVRPILKSIIKVPSELNPSEFGSYSEKLIGREAMVFKAITNAELGVVKLIDFDETWLAKSSSGDEIGQGTAVKIEKLEGNHLIVSAL